MSDSTNIPRVPAGVEVVPILDFGSQFVQLIARRVREAGAFSILLAPDTPVEVLQALRPKGIILSGGPSSVDGENAPTCDPRILDMGVPVLGVCYGLQLMCSLLGGRVVPADKREYGRAKLAVEGRGGVVAGEVLGVVAPLDVEVGVGGPEGLDDAGLFDDVFSDDAKTGDPEIDAYLDEDDDETPGMENIDDHVDLF